MVWSFILKEEPKFIITSAVNTKLSLKWQFGVYSTSVETDSLVFGDYSDIWRYNWACYLSCRLHVETNSIFSVLSFQLQANCHYSGTPFNKHPSNVDTHDI